MSSVLNLGVFMRYLSVPMMSGFTAGAALHVFSSQVSTLFGLDIAKPTGTFNLARLYYRIGGKLWQNFIQRVA